MLGGWLTDSYSWRWVFYINLPVGILSILMVYWFVFDPSYIKRDATARIDYWGIGMLAVWIAALQLAFDKGQQMDWFNSPFIVGLLVIAGTFLIAFLVRELMAEHPVVNLRIFKVGSYSTGVFLMAVLGFVLYGSIVILPIWLQTLMGYPATQAGLTMAPRGLGSMIAMPLVGIILPRFDARKLLATGLLMGAFSTWQFAQMNLNVGYWDLFWPQFMQGVGTGTDLRAADDHLDGPGAAREHGERDQPLQPDAQSGRRGGDRGDRHAQYALPAEIHQHSGLARGPGRSGDGAMVRLP